MKISISIDENILQQLDAYADSQHLTRSAAIVKALGIALERYEAHEALRRAAEVADSIAEAAYITEEQARKYKKAMKELDSIVNNPF